MILYKIIKHLEFNKMAIKIMYLLMNQFKFKLIIFIQILLLIIVLKIVRKYFQNKIRKIPQKNIFNQKIFLYLLIILKLKVKILPKLKIILSKTI